MDKQGLAATTRGLGQTHPKGLRKEPGLRIPWSLTASLQNCEKVVLVLSHPVWGNLFWQLQNRMQRLRVQCWVEFSLMLTKSVTSVCFWKIVDFQLTSHTRRGGIS